MRSSFAAMKSLAEFANAACLTAAGGEVSLLHVRWRAMHSHMRRKLRACRQDRLRRALGEIGRIERTPFIPDWIEPPPRPAADGTRGRSLQERNPARSGQRRVHPLQGTHPWPLPGGAAEEGHGPQPGHRRHHVLEHACMDKAAGHLERRGLLPEPEPPFARRSLGEGGRQEARKPLDVVQRA